MIPKRFSIIVARHECTQHNYKSLIPVFFFQARNRSSVNTQAARGGLRTAATVRSTVTSTRPTSRTIVELPAATSPTHILVRCASIWRYVVCNRETFDLRSTLLSVNYGCLRIWMVKLKAYDAYNIRTHIDIQSKSSAITFRKWNKLLFRFHFFSRIYKTMEFYRASFSRSIQSKFSELCRSFCFEIEIIARKLSRAN